MSYAVRKPIGNQRAMQPRVTTRLQLVPRRRGLGEICGGAPTAENYACALRNIAAEEARYQQIYGTLNYATQTYPAVYVPNPVGWVCVDQPWRGAGFRFCANTGNGGTYSGTGEPGGEGTFYPGGINPVVAPIGTVAPVPPPAGASSYSPRVSFAGARGGSTLYPGDAWTIRITGAEPGADVFVRGGKNGATDTNRMGAANNQGVFTLTGVADSSEIGTWNETWTAGGVNAGSFGFTIVSGPGGSPGGNYYSLCAPPQVMKNGQCVLTDEPTVTPPPLSSSMLDWFKQETFAGIPNWVLLVGGAGAVMFLGGKK